MQAEQFGMEDKSPRNGSNSSKIIEDPPSKILSRILLAACFALVIVFIVVHFLFRHQAEGSILLEEKSSENRAFSFHLLNDITEVTEEPNISSAGGSISPENRRGCFQLACRLDCIQNEDIYTEAAAVMNDTNCEVITSLSVLNQSLDYIGNSWVDVNMIVLKITLSESQIQKIKNGAFSSRIFSKVVHMIWLDLKTDSVSNGALLGLYSLRKLEIMFKLPSLDISVLQPVQTTLTLLKLNCGIIFKSTSNVFGNLSLDKLVHLDLSRNTFVGPLSKNIFEATPNISYLYLENCFITSIEDTAFEDVAKSLVLVDLKHNLLTQISADLLSSGKDLILFDLEPNDWHCNCELRALINFFKEKKGLFASIPYCRMPLTLYGKSFDELSSKELQCEDEEDVTEDIATTSEENTEPSVRGEEIGVTPTNIIPYGPIVQFRCSQAIAVTKDNEISETREKRDLKSVQKADNFVFEPPNYDLNLQILQNRSVRAVIEEYVESDSLNIIWFTEEDSSDALVENSAKKDYNCMLYEKPYLTTDPLHQNHTYTFCMMSSSAVVVSPLFCQPLHIPLEKSHTDTNENWDSDSDKQFTVAMLCLVFFISIIFGAIFAYLGIKSFPNLLEGSKNVVVIKESDKTCHVSTIGESLYGKSSINKVQFQKNSLKVAEYETSKAYSAGLPEPSLPASDSQRSSSTCFDDCFSDVESQSLAYEMPMPYAEARKLSTYVERPNSPPPLPKRNSSAYLSVDQLFSPEKLSKQA